MGTEIVVKPYYHRDKRDFGGARRDRTADLLHAMQALSQLSYSPKLRRRVTVREPLWGVKEVPRSCRPNPLQDGHPAPVTRIGPTFGW